MAVRALSLAVLWLATAASAEWCPELKPVDEGDCPKEELGELVWHFNCDDRSLQVGDWCKAKNNECGVRKDLNNCYYKKPDADIYIVTALPEDMDDDPEPLPPQPGCPKLKPVKRSECPDESKNELVYFFSCDDVNLKKGDWCKANRDECGVSKSLNNCFYQKAGADIYIVEEAAGGDNDDKPPPEDGCPELRPLDEDECPDYDKGELVWYFECDNKALKLNDMCKSNGGECGTSKSLKNCYYKNKWSDLYIVTKPAEGGDDDAPATDDDTPEEGCPKLRPLDPDAGECPDYDAGEYVYYFSCDKPELRVDDFCKSDKGECGTNKKLQQCFYKNKMRSLYKVVEAAYDDDGGTDDGAGDDGGDDGAPAGDDNSPSDDGGGDDGTADDGGGGDDAPADDAPADDAPPDDVYYVDTKVRFHARDLALLVNDDGDEGYLAGAVGRAIVSSGVVAEESDVLRVTWGETVDVDDEEFERRLATTETTPALLSLKLRAVATTAAERAAAEGPADVVATRLQKAVRGDGVRSLEESFKDEAGGDGLAAACWYDGTYALASADTTQRDGPPPEIQPTMQPSRMPTDDAGGDGGVDCAKVCENCEFYYSFDVCQVEYPACACAPVGDDAYGDDAAPAPAPGPAPTTKPRGGGKKKKSDDDEIIEGMDNAGAIVLILFLCIIGCCCLVALAAGAVMANDGEGPFKSKNERGGSFGDFGETELGSRAPGYYKDDDDAEAPAYPEDDNGSRAYHDDADDQGSRAYEPRLDDDQEDDGTDYRKSFTVHTAGEDTYAGGAWPAAEGDDDDDTYAGKDYGVSNSIHHTDMDTDSDHSDLGSKMV